MALLDKLHIQGIRSYSPLDNDLQEVKFISPITLIMGQNGSGKTTVIESLKYATTGDLPPGCDRGKSFVHDPQLVHQAEVQALIRLRFKDTARQTWTIARYPKVIQKYKKTEFKTTDVSLSMADANGQKKDFRGRLANVDSVLCNALGVTRPILDNVIFCHQEDSCWPMEEAKKLKEKFDAIFDVTKYNKATDSVRKIAKTYDAEAKELKRNLFHYKDKKVEADEKKRKLRETEQKMAKTTEEIEVFATGLERTKKRLQDLREKENNYAKIYNEVELEKTSMNNLKKQLQEKRQSLQNEEFEGTDEELEEALNDFEKKLQEKQDALAKLKVQQSKLQAEEEHILKSINIKQVEKGRLEAQIKHHENNIKSRNEAIHNLASDLGLEISDQLEDINVNSLSQQVEKKIACVKKDLDTLKQQIEEDEHNLQEKLDKYREELAKLNQELDTKKKALTSKKSDERMVARQLASLQHTEIEIQSVESQVEEADEKFNVAESMHNAENWTEKITEAKEKRNRLQEKLHEMDILVRELQRQSDTLSQIKYEKEQKSKKESEMQKILTKIKTPMTLLFKEVPTTEIKKAVTTFLSQCETTHREKTKVLETKQRELIKAELDCKAQEKKLHEMEEEIQRNEDVISDLCGSDDLESSLMTLEDQIKILQNEKGTLSSSELMYRHYIELMKESEPCCPLCHRGFQAQADVKKLIIELTGKISDVPTRIQDNKRQLEKLESKQKSLLEIRPAFQRCTRLKTNDVPATNTSIKEMKKKLEAIRSKIEEINGSITEVTTKINVAKSINNDVVFLDKLESEVKVLDKKIQQLSAKVTGDTTQDLQQVMNEQSTLREELNEASHELDDIQDRFNSSKEELNKLRDMKNRLVERKLKMQGDLQERKALEQKKDAIEEDLVTLQVDINELTEKLVPAKKQVDKCLEEKAKLKEENSHLRNSKESELSKYQKKMSEVQRLTLAVNEFESSGVIKKFENVKEAIEALEKNKESNNMKKQSVSDEIQKLNNYMSSQKIEERELLDNKEIRKLKKREEELNVKLEDLKKQLQAINYREIANEKKRYEAEEENLLAQKAHLQGRLKELEGNTRTLRQELNNPVYRDAEKNLNEKLIAIKVKECTRDDLERYSKAIDYAITHFHTERMNIINRIIRSLWRQIYCGNDIDHIEIKTSSENKNASNLKRRSYNYRVVQVKSGVEMDMRGRCSGGQKILASLIIRLALAETFSSKCAFFALDEPTANLDRDNIESFARALADIVKARCANTNAKFQLLIITHDQEFLNLLHDQQLLTDYYDVKRDHRGKSVIKRKSVSLV